MKHRKQSTFTKQGGSMEIRPGDKKILQGGNYMDGHGDELISEWEQCREDERNAQNQQIQVIATVGAILGGLYTVAALIVDRAEKLVMSALFYTSSLSLLVAISYIATIGITNVLRYHYMRDLEDRLYQLNPCPPKEESFTHWMSFCSPITTRNPLHIGTSPYTVIHYLYYGIATFGALAFRVMMVIFQYHILPETSALDRAALDVILLFIPVTLCLFVWFSIRAKDMYALAAKKAAKNRAIRLSAEELCLTTVRQNSPAALRKILLYFFYPKQKDFQKSLLILAGFGAGAWISGQNQTPTQLLLHGFLI